MRSVRTSGPILEILNLGSRVFISPNFSMPEFQLVSPFQPSGDQPQAIQKLVDGIRAGEKVQNLMGVTGSGKTFTMANIIQQIQRPTLVMSHNKTLAAQLFSEFKQFFPHNAVTYFVSYYDYYQPEAYIPQRDIYIEKDAAVNQEIDRLRLATTSALVSRRDVIVVASVSSIYGLGSPSDYKKMVFTLSVDDILDRDEFLAKLVEIQYERNDTDLDSGKFRARGDCVEIFPTYEEFAFRVEFWGDTVEQISIIDPTSGEVCERLQTLSIYPAKHFVLPEEKIEDALVKIRRELSAQLEYFKDQGKLLEAQRLSARTRYDMEMLQQVGYCPGVENYSQPLSGREPGSAPDTLFSFFPDDYLLFVDESHVTVPQIRGMQTADRNRKKTLVEHGFRLPSAMDNRPLTFDEWEERVNQVVYVSATPGPYELAQTQGRYVEQIIRPTGLLDPIIEVVPATACDAGGSAVSPIASPGQVPHLLEQVRERAAKGERVLVTTLTKRLAEDLSDYFLKKNVRCKWLHSELDAFERVELLRELREGKFDVLVGVNLLREGLDLPEVSLVAILDADKEGFLRSETSLMQTIGRSARNVNAKVILYADKITEAMRHAIDETARRRELQHQFNEAHGITPQTIQKNIHRGIEKEAEAFRHANAAIGRKNEDQIVTEQYISELEAEMMEAAEKLEFERAAAIRDRISKLREQIGAAVSEVKETAPKKRRRRSKA